MWVSVVGPKCEEEACFKEHGGPLIGSNGRIDSDEIVGSTMVMAMVIRGR